LKLFRWRVRQGIQGADAPSSGAGQEGAVAGQEERPRALSLLEKPLVCRVPGEARGHAQEAEVAGQLADHGVAEGSQGRGRRVAQPPGRLGAVCAAGKTNLEVGEGEALGRLKRGLHQRKVGLGVRTVADGPHQAKVEA